MNLNEAKQMFDGLGTADVNRGRGKIEPGKYWILMRSIENKKSREMKPFVACQGTVILPLCDAMGRDPSSEMFEGSPPGSTADWAIFFNDYFASRVKTVIVTCLGMSEEDLKAQEATMSKDARNDEFFQYMLAATGETVNEAGTDTIKTQPGIFDNCTVIEIRVWVSEPKPVPEGETPKKSFTNIVPVAKISLEEVAEKVSEEHIIMFFGSVDAFTKLYEAEEALNAAD